MSSFFDSDGELSAADIQRLMADDSPATRAATAAKVARTFGDRRLTETERDLAEQVIRIMAHDVEVRVRQALSENLKDNPDVPRELALRLARDVAEVATPILQFSAALTEEDLLQIVESDAGQAHKAAVARREVVPETVSVALVEHGDETVVGTLMENAGAELPESALARAIDRFGESETVSAAMVQRPKLPIAISERLVALVSETLRQHLVTRHALPPETVADLLLQTREQALIGMLAEGQSSRDVQSLIVELHANGRLTPSLIMRALCTGDVDFFESTLAHLAGIPVQNAHQLICDAGGRGLEALYLRAGQPQELLPIVRAAVDVAHELEYDGLPGDRPRFVETVIERVLTRFEDVAGTDDVDWLITRLSRAQAAQQAAQQAAGEQSQPQPAGPPPAGPR